MEDFKFSAAVLNERARNANTAGFSETVDPHNIVDLRPIDELQNLSLRGQDYLRGVQDEIIAMLRKRGGKSEADTYLHEQGVKWGAMNSDEAVRIRTELADYRLAVTFAMDA